MKQNSSIAIVILLNADIRVGFYTSGKSETPPEKGGPAPRLEQSFNCERISNVTPRPAIKLMPADSDYRGGDSGKASSPMHPSLLSPKIFRKFKHVIKKKWRLVWDWLKPHYRRLDEKLLQLEKNPVELPVQSFYPPSASGKPEKLCEYFLIHKELEFSLDLGFAIKIHGFFHQYADNAMGYRQGSAIILLMDVFKIDKSNFKHFNTFFKEDWGSLWEHRHCIEKIYGLQITDEYSSQLEPFTDNSLIPTPTQAIFRCFKNYLNDISSQEEAFDFEIQMEREKIHMFRPEFFMSGASLSAGKLILSTQQIMWMEPSWRPFRLTIRNRLSKFAFCQSQLYRLTNSFTTFSYRRILALAIIFWKHNRTRNGFFRRQLNRFSLRWRTAFSSLLRETDALVFSGFAKLNRIARTYLEYTETDKQKSASLNPDETWRQQWRDSKRRHSVITVATSLIALVVNMELFEKELENVLSRLKHFLKPLFALPQFIIDLFIDSGSFDSVNSPFLYLILKILLYSGIIIFALLISSLSVFGLYILIRLIIKFVFFLTNLLLLPFRFLSKLFFRKLVHRLTIMYQWICR